jgi:hypothetical protein
MRMHRSFTMSGGVGAKTKSRSPNQPHAIRSKNRFWRAAMRREAGGHENFFIAKNRDSESAQRTFGRHRRGAMTSFTRRSLNALIAKTSAAQAFHATLTIAGIGFSRTVCVTAPMVDRVPDQCASRALTSSRQHFLKRDAVFLSVLVYSGCSASRFPSARSD